MRSAVLPITLLVTAILCVCSTTVRRADSVAYYRFEDTIPAAYYRRENVYTDHSGHGNHLDFAVNGISTVVYNNTLDGNPQHVHCASNVGLGCSQVSQNRVYQSSSSVPPSSMFNVPAAPRASEISVRNSIYEVETQEFPACGGLLSFNPGALDDTSSSSALYYDPLRIAGNASSASPLSFAADFTIEGFFKTNGTQSHTGPMTILEHNDTHNDFCYAIDLNTAGPGSFRFALGPAPFPAVEMSGNYANGDWYYFVARFSKEASGPGSKSKLVVKILSSDNQLSFGLASTSVDFRIATSSGNLYVGKRSDGTQRFHGVLDEIRLSNGLVDDEDLLGNVAADYSYAPTSPRCLAQQTLTNRKGSLFDGTPNGVEYTNGLDCRWLINQSSLNPAYGSPNEGAFIVLTFTEFSTEPHSDTVTIYDGENTSAPVLGEYSGYDVPQLPIVSSGPMVLVRFISDSKQNLQQLGWKAEYVSIALSQPRCAAVNEGHSLTLSCPGGYVISRVNFASYGTPTGFCSNGARTSVGQMRDVNTYLYDDMTNVNGVSNGVSAGAGAGGVDGTIMFKTGFCHSNNSRAAVESACKDQASCSLMVNDSTFNGNPCIGMYDTKLGITGTNDAGVLGADVYPFRNTPYAGAIQKRLLVQVTCESQSAFAANCFEECQARGSCFYGMASPHCNWCTEYGLSPTSEGGYTGMGCGTAFCVKNATCGTPVAVQP